MEKPNTPAKIHFCMDLWNCCKLETGAPKTHDGWCEMWTRQPNKHPAQKWPKGHWMCLFDEWIDVAGLLRCFGSFKWSPDEWMWKGNTRHINIFFIVLMCIKLNQHIVNYVYLTQCLLRRKLSVLHHCNKILGKLCLWLYIMFSFWH